MVKILKSMVDGSCDAAWFAMKKLVDRVPKLARIR